MGNIVLGGRYAIENEIGTGGMAIVYKAHDNLLNRSVAVKVLRPEYKQDEDFIKRFDAEAKSAAGLSHPNIVGIYDVGIHEGYRYIVMEHLEGVTLKTYISDKGRLPWRTALKFASQICSALAHAHERKIIHRDIKPHNIMVTRDGSLKVMDFGIARATTAATVTIGSKVLGSAHYLSPEQARGGFTDERSDLYSLGVCIYEMITGKVPFDAETTVAVAMQHLQKTPQNPSELVEYLPASVEYIILKAMRKEQSQRYLTAQRMESDIIRVLADSDVVLSDDDEAAFYSTRQIEIVQEEIEEKKKNKKSKLWIIILGAVLGTALTVGILLAILLGGDKTVETPNLKGITLEEALIKVKEIDEEIVIYEEWVASENEYKNKILEQQPEEGRPISGSKEIYVKIGSGEESFELEEYVGYKAEEAKDIAEEQGLVCIFEEEDDDDFNEKTEKGYVSRQEPREGTIVRNGDAVTLYVSRGDEDIAPKMPGVTGMMIEEARKKLNEKDLYNITVSEVESEEVSGTVVEQSCPEGERIDKESEIVLTVAKNKPVLKFVVPEGSSAVNVKVIRNDNGETVYKRTHNPLDEVKVELNIKGTVVYEIYINDVFFEEKSVQG